MFNNNKWRKSWPSLEARRDAKENAAQPTEDNAVTGHRMVLNGDYPCAVRPIAAPGMTAARVSALPKQDPDGINPGTHNVGAPGLMIP